MKNLVHRWAQNPQPSTYNSPSVIDTDGKIYIVYSKRAGYFIFSFFLADVNNTIVLFTYLSIETDFTNDFKITETNDSHNEDRNRSAVIL